VNHNLGKREAKDFGKGNEHAGGKDLSRGEWEVSWASTHPRKDFLGQAAPYDWRGKAVLAELTPR